MAKKNVSTPQDYRDGMAKLEYFESLTPAEKEVYIAECEPPLAAALRKGWAANPTSGNREKKIKPRPVSTPERLKSNLIVLDFTPYDVVRALDDLRAMVLAGEVTGIVFAASISGEKKPIFGATGRLKDNPAEAIGAAAMLQRECLEHM